MLQIFRFFKSREVWIIWDQRVNNSFHQEKLEFHSVYELAFATKLPCYIRSPSPGYIQKSDSLNKLVYLQRSHLILSWISSIQVQLEFGDVGFFFFRKGESQSIRRKILEGRRRSTKLHLHMTWHQGTVSNLITAAVLFLISAEVLFKQDFSRI